MIEEIYTLKNELSDLQAVLKETKQSNLQVVNSLHLKLHNYKDLNQKLVRQINRTWKMKIPACSAQALPRRHSF